MPAGRISMTNSGKNREDRQISVEHGKSPLKHSFRLVEHRLADHASISARMFPHRRYQSYGGRPLQPLACHHDIFRAPMLRRPSGGPPPGNTSRAPRGARPKNSSASASMVLSSSRKPMILALAENSIWPTSSCGCRISFVALAQAFVIEAEHPRIEAAIRAREKRRERNEFDRLFRHRYLFG
jgi:hypothetical protein